MVITTKEERKEINHDDNSNNNRSKEDGDSDVAYEINNNLDECDDESSTFEDVINSKNVNKNQQIYASVDDTLSTDGIKNTEQEQQEEKETISNNNNTNDMLSIIKLKYRNSVENNKPEPLQFIMNIEFHDNIHNNHNNHSDNDDEINDNDNDNNNNVYIIINDNFFNEQDDDNDEKNERDETNKDDKGNNDNKASNKKPKVFLNELYNHIYYPINDITNYVMKNNNDNSKETLLRYLQMQVLLRLRYLSQTGKCLTTTVVSSSNSKNTNKKHKKSKKKNRNKSNNNEALNEICNIISLLPLYIIDIQLNDILYNWLYVTFYVTLHRFIIKIYEHFEIKVPSKDENDDDKLQKKDLFKNSSLLVKTTKPTTDKLFRSISLPLPDTIIIPNNDTSDTTTSIETIEEKTKVATKAIALKRSTSLPYKKIKLNNNDVESSTKIYPSTTATINNNNKKHQRNKKINRFLNDTVTHKYTGNHFSSGNVNFKLHTTTTNAATTTTKNKKQPQSKNARSNANNQPTKTNPNQASLRRIDSNDNNNDNIFSIRNTTKYNTHSKNIVLKPIRRQKRLFFSNTTNNAACTNANNNSQSSHHNSNNNELLSSPQRQNDQHTKNLVLQAALAATNKKQYKK